ncbi:hypothetical protein [Nonomuraea roseoviolacea]|uniref:Uncharacterized protein n=1 Tax=Nonomuraea roseoviolacea subsp. carminata TaxID=160689 RepID=A0ABT1JV93_9ACTN|nr:hypothetical protein [Nonomuraea roseoviolacea]MCP2345186.1 hypothetical protein [Nonomuraea roseoviolacea subsp. carminata]
MPSPAPTRHHSASAAKLSLCVIMREARSCSAASRVERSSINAVRMSTLAPLAVIMSCRCSSWPSRTPLARSRAANTTRPGRPAT